MTFQRKTALRIIALVRSLKPGSPRRGRRLRSQPRPRSLHGGWRAASTSSSAAKGEVTFRELLRAIEAGRGISNRFSGLSYRREDGWHDNPSRPVHSLDGDDIRLPKRDARVLSGYTMMGRAGRRRRNLARLHLRLRLLLHHRDARPQLSHLHLRPRPRRHSRCPRSWRARHLHRRRQYQPEHQALRGAVPGHHRRRLERH